jgi:tetratricopeptide (TPR) repeat protein
VPEPSPTATAEPEEEPTPTQAGVLFDYLYAVRLLEAAQWEDAIPAFGLVIRRLPEYARAYYGRGRAYYHEDRLLQALEDFDIAIEFNDELPQAYADRGVLHMDEGRTEEAISDLLRALDLYERLGNLPKAVEVAQILNRLR